MLLLPFALLATLYPSQGAPPPDNAAQLEASTELSQLLELRELDPYDPFLLDRLAQTYEKLGKHDEHVAFLIAALDAYESMETDDSKEKQAKLAQLGSALNKAEPTIAQLRQARTEYVKSQFFALQLYAGNQAKYRNALDVAGRILRYRSDHREARRLADTAIAKMDMNAQKQASKLLGQREVSRPRSFHQAWQEKHTDWNSADKVATRRYEIRTDISYDVMQKAASALEQMADHYSAFYGVDEKGVTGLTAVNLYRRRHDFERLCVESMQGQIKNPGLCGYLSTVKYSDGRFVFRVDAFDPRDQGRPLESLWQTLWHEASHQYTALAAGMDEPPLWLNEGMASYFEGAVLDADGEVYIGRPSISRMRDLHGILEKNKNVLRDTIEATDWMPAEQYAVAWGLVYYLTELVDPLGKRFPAGMLLPMFRPNGVPSYQLFEEHVLRRLGLSYDQFQAQWIAAMRDHHEAEKDQQALLGDMLKKARAAESTGDWDSASEWNKDVIVRDFDNTEALLALARHSKKISDAQRGKSSDLKDEALLRARRAHRSALIHRNEAAEKDAESIATALDPGGFARMGSGEKAYRKKVAGVIAQQLERDCRKTAAQIAKRYLDDVLGGNEASNMVREWRLSGVMELVRVVRVFDGKTLEMLNATPQYSRVMGGEIVTDAPRPRGTPLHVLNSTTPVFSFEGEIWLGDPNACISMMMWQPIDSLWQGFALRPDDDGKTALPEVLYVPFDVLERGCIANLDELFDPEIKQYRLGLSKGVPKSGVLKTKKWTWFRLHRKEANTLVLEINGRIVAKRTIKPNEDPVEVGLHLYGGQIKVRNLRVVETDNL